MLTGKNIEKLIKKMRKPSIFFDGWHIFDPAELRKMDELSIMGVGYD